MKAMIMMMAVPARFRFSAELLTALKIMNYPAASGRGIKLELRNQIHKRRQMNLT